MIVKKIKKIKLPYKILIYDIETTLLMAYLFRLGEQRINHSQLFMGMNLTNIICIAYKWYHEKDVHILTGPDMIEQFDKLAREADVCLGKNSDRFDVKHINTQRMLQGLEPYPEWCFQAEDLEKQLRKYFAFPSQSLDYISHLLGLGGKEKMEFNNWVSIAQYDMVIKAKLNNHSCVVLFDKSSKQVHTEGKKALAKMYHYNKKDVLDTESILVRVLPYIKLKYNAGLGKEGLNCATCGSSNIYQDGTRQTGKSLYQQFKCRDHHGYAGRATLTFKIDGTKNFGKVG